VTDIALTRAVSTSLANCELTYLSRAPIDIDLARRQHAAYEALLASLGYDVVSLPRLDDQPDAVFIEDAGLALDEVAIVAPMGAPSRAAESASVADALACYLPVLRLTSPATLDGGDVLRAGRQLFVGRSQRTNSAAIDQLTQRLAPHGYDVTAIDVGGALHLKSACAYLGGFAMLVNPDWIDVTPLGDFELVACDASEPWGASALLAGDTLVMAAGFPRTAGALRDRGLDVHEIDLSELRKAEGGPTCLSILLKA
jgi:dimethylargininase